jgi:hypothetical protein
MHLLQHHRHYACKMNVKLKKKGLHSFPFPHHVNTLMKKIISRLMQTSKDLFRRTPKFLDGLNYESKGEDRRRS